MLVNVRLNRGSRIVLIEKEEDIPEGYRKVPKEELIRECRLFKNWSGPVLVRLLYQREHDLKPLGSGGLINYRGRYFVITNEHVIRNIPEDERNGSIIIPYQGMTERTISLKFWGLTLIKR